MTKKNYTHIVYVIDESGSMQPLKENTINNYSKFIKEQKQIPNECTFSLYRINNVLFNYFVLDHTLRIKPPVENNETVPKSISLVPENLIYTPNGSTPLFDTLGNAIDQTGKFLSNLKEEDRPEKVIVIIDTDGQENASNNYDLNKIKEMIEHQQNVYNWNFLFFGANQDSFATGKAMGINFASIADYKHDLSGNDAKYGVMSKACYSLRSGGDVNIGAMMAEADKRIKITTV